MTTSPLITDQAARERDPGAYDIRSTLETITLLCEENGEPCDGFRFRELILKARTFLSTAATTGSAPVVPTLKEIWEGAEYPELKKHRWDKAGERCLDCGQSEYIGGECIPASDGPVAIPPIFYNGDTKRNPALRAACDEQVRAGLAAASPAASALTDTQLSEIDMAACEWTDDWSERQELTPSKEACNAMFIRRVIALLAASMGAIKERPIAAPTRDSRRCTVAIWDGPKKYDMGYPCPTCSVCGVRKGAPCKSDRPQSIAASMGGDRHDPSRH